MDDDSILLDNLKRLLLAERSQWEVRTTTTGAEAVRLLKSEPMDLLVADIQMPGMDGLALLAEVRRDPALARLPVIFMTARDDRTSFREGMSSGADDYLPKPFSIEELIQAMEARLKRQAQESSPPRDDQALFDELANTLTGRELEVLALIGHGLVTKDIAATLKVSYRTVSVHRTNIMRKLNLHNAAALAALANKASMA
ncbi:MAG: response regulator transcription factor [Holophaga sp.]|nr:response regulator transcription factor [Holophaga sp.]